MRTNLRHSQLAWPLVLGLCLVSSVVAEPPAWPQFRGPDGQGEVDAANVRWTWSDEQGVRFKTPLPGRGWSSPVVLEDQIWMTTALEGSKSAGEKGTIKVDSIKLHALCVDRKTGKLMHDIPLFATENPEQIHAQNSYASPTPVVEPGRVYCHFGRFGTACLDTTSGEILWQRQFEINHYVGPGSSPVLFENLLILTCDGADQQYLVAVDKVTGDDVWKQPRPPLSHHNDDQHKSFATPLIVEYQGEPQLISPGSQWFVTYDPRTGKPIWQVEHGDGFSLVARPVVEGDFCYLCCGFSGSGVMAIRLGGSGDVTKTHVQWTWRQQAPNQPSMVAHAGRLVMISDNGVAQCIDAVTQDVVWKKRVGGNYSASVLRLGDRYAFFSHEGVTTIVDSAGEKVAENTLEGALMATPAIVEDEWIIRTSTHLYAILAPE